MSNLLNSDLHPTGILHHYPSLVSQEEVNMMEYFTAEIMYKLYFSVTFFVVVVIIICLYVHWDLRKTELLLIMLAKYFREGKNGQ